MGELIQGEPGALTDGRRPAQPQGGRCAGGLLGPHWALEDLNSAPLTDAWDVISRKPDGHLDGQILKILPVTKTLKPDPADGGGEGARPCSILNSRNVIGLGCGCDSGMSQRLVDGETGIGNEGARERQGTGVCPLNPSIGPAAQVWLSVY